MLVFKPAPLDEAAIRHIIREAEPDVEPGEDAKPAIVRALVSHLAGVHAPAVEAAITEQIELGRMIEQPEAEIIAEIIAGLPEAVKAQVNEMEPPIGSPPALAYRIARAVIEDHVPEKDYGKWLAKFGIVSAHIKAISKTETAPEPVLPPPPTPPPPPPPPPAAEADPEMAALLGEPPSSAPTPAAAPPPPASESRAPSAEPGSHSAPAAEKGDLGAAFKLIAAALDSFDERFSKRLGISRTTLANYLSGRTAPRKFTPEQARVMAAELDVRSSKLREAASIFSRVVT